MAPTTRPTRSVRVLLAPETFNLGETSRCVEVAKELRRTGHEVLLVGYSRRFVDHIERAHLPFRFLSPELTNAQADQLLALDQGRGWRNPFTAEVIRERVRSELAAMADFRPDVAVIGSTASIFLSARIAGIPLVYVKPWALSRGHLNRATALPITALPPPFGTAINRVARRALTSILERSTWKPRAFRRVAADHHLHLPRRTFDAIDADLNLIASHTPLVEGWTLPENDVAVGPIYATDDSDLPPAVAELAGWDRPLVYVGLGSSANRPLALRLLEQVAAADVEVVTSAGRYLRAADRAALPGNVHVHDFLPAHRLAGLIEASIIHGGEGTVQTACASGVPFAGIGLQVEQRINIAACAEFGNAIELTHRHIRRGEIPDVVERLVDDPFLRARARLLADAMAQLDGPGSAARQIVEFAMSDPPSTMGR